MFESVSRSRSCVQSGDDEERLSQGEAELFIRRIIRVLSPFEVSAIYLFFFWVFNARLRARLQSIWNTFKTRLRNA